MTANGSREGLSKTLPFWLIEKNEHRKEDYYFKLLFQDIVTMNFSIPGIVEEGEVVAVIDTDGGQAIVPEKRIFCCEEIKPSYSRKGFVRILKRNHSCGIRGWYN